MLLAELATSRRKMSGAVWLGGIAQSPENCNIERFARHKQRH